MRSMKKLLTIVLAMAMIFSFASTAFAADTATLNIVIDGTVLDTVSVNAGESVYTAVDAWAKAKDYEIKWKDVSSDIGDGTGKVLESLDGKTSVPYNNGEEYEIYDPEDSNDPVLDEANKVLEETYPTSGGLYLWLGDGVGMNRTGQYGIYVGEDWMFTINGKRPVDIADTSVELYMNQAIIAADDVVELTYGMVYEPYEM